MPITVKHDAPAAAYGIPAFYAGQEDLRRYMDKMEQQRAQMMLQAQQAREENAVKVALAGAQLEAQANNQRAGQMHDFQKMQFGAGLNAAQDKVNFEQQQAFQQAGQNFQAAENKKAQDAIAARMEQARQDQATAKAEYIKQQEEAAKKAEADRKQGILNSAAPPQNDRAIDSLSAAIDIAAGGMVPGSTKSAAAEIIRQQESQKTPQQIAREALLQTHDYSPEDTEAIKTAKKKIASLEVANLTQQEKFDAIRPHQEILDRTMPTVRRPSIEEQIVTTADGIRILPKGIGDVVMPAKVTPFTQWQAQRKENIEVGEKIAKNTNMEDPHEVRAFAIKHAEYEERLAEVMASRMEETQKMRANGKSAAEIKAELDRSYPLPVDERPTPQPAPAGSQPSVPVAAPAATPAGQQPAPQAQPAVPRNTVRDSLNFGVGIGNTAAQLSQGSQPAQQPATVAPVTTAPGIVAPATVKPLTAAEQSFAKLHEVWSGGHWPDSQNAKMEQYNKLVTDREKIAKEAARDEKGNPRKPHEIAAIVEDKAPLPVVAKEPMVIHPGKNLTVNLKAGDVIPPPVKPSDIQMWGSRSVRDGYETHARIYEAAKSQQKKEIVQRVQAEHDVNLPPAQRSSFVPVNAAERDTLPGIAGMVGVDIDGKYHNLPVVTDIEALRRMPPGSRVVFPDGKLVEVPQR